MQYNVYAFKSFLFLQSIWKNGVSENLEVSENHFIIYMFTVDGRHTFLQGRMMIEQVYQTLWESHLSLVGLPSEAEEGG